MDLTQVYSPFNGASFQTGVQNKDEKNTNSESDVQWRVGKDSPKFLICLTKAKVVHEREQKSQEYKNDQEVYIHNLEYTKENLEWKVYDVNWGPGFPGFEQLLILTWQSSEQNNKAVAFCYQKRFDCSFSITCRSAYIWFDSFGNGCSNQ